MEQPLLEELLPTWPEAAAHCRHRARPAYRYLPGLHPHPVRDPAGHRYPRQPDRAPEPFPEPWQECEAYLFGVDLYHEGYLWEAHETLEDLWRPMPHAAAERHLLQALIMNAVARFKLHQGSSAGALKLSWRAHEILRQTAATWGESPLLGLHLRGLEMQVEKHYGSLWLHGRPPEGHAPRLELERA